VALVGALVAGLLGAPLTPAQRAELRRWLEPALREVELPEALRSVLTTSVAAVQEGAVDWARLREFQQSGGAIAATVLHVVADGYVVDVGVTAHWRTTATERWQRGDEVLMVVRKVDEENCYVVVHRHPDDFARSEYAQPRPDPALALGREVEAWVCSVQPYGVYVRFERRTALLRVDAMPEGCTPSSFAHGQTLRVAITAVTFKGVAVRLATPAPEDPG
jgi:ribosomal protein S1